MKTITLISILININLMLNAQTAITSTSTGDWSNTASWNISSVPSSTDDVHITTGNTITISSGIVNCNKLTIDNGAGLHVTNNACLHINGDWNNSGDFNPASGTVKFTGSTQQTIGGTSSCAFNNIEINNTAGVVFSSDQKIKGILSLNQGTLTTTGFNFTFLSDNNSTASIAEIHSGADIIGNITMQRYMKSASTGWRLLSSPVNGATLQDWTDDFITSGFPGSTYPSFSFCSIYTYDETAPGTSYYGYNMPTGITQSIVPGTGYWAWVGPTPLITEVTGTPKKFNHTFSVSFTPSAGDIEDGWNLISNPYPSAINWDAAGWTKSGINDAVYIWDPSLEQYSYYIKGVSVNGGSNIITSSQAFLVQTYQNNPILSCNETVKTSSDVDYLRINTTSINYSNIIKLSLTGGNNINDQTAICFSQGASANFNPSEDAVKLCSDNALANSISSVSYTTDLAINNLPSTTYTVPLRVKVGSSGIYTIKKDTSLILSPATCLYLEDLVTNTQTDFGPYSSGTYSFSINDTTVAPRFILHIGQPLSKSNVSPTCSYKQNGKAIVTGNGTGPWDITWKNSAGNTIATHLNVTTTDTLKNLAPGKYPVEVAGNSGFCTSLTDTIFVTAQNPIIVSPVITSVTCKGQNNGAIDANMVTDATYPLNYNWSNGSLSSVVNNLTIGTYTLVLVDANGCSDTSFYAVNQISNLTLNFNMSSDTVNLTNSIITFTNLTTGYNSVSWNFGDGSPATSNYSPTHTFLNPGTFTVELTASDNLCYDTLTKKIVVLNVTGINSQILNNDNVFVYKANGEAAVRFNLQSTEDAEISVYSLDGKLINTKTVSANTNTENIALGEASAIYLVQVSINGNKLVKKLIK